MITIVVPNFDLSTIGCCDEVLLGFRKLAHYYRLICLRLLKYNNDDLITNYNYNFVDSPFLKEIDLKS